MQRPHFVVKKHALTLGLLALAVCATANAGEVYQWKDAHGVTQYSSTPPAQGAYRTRTIHNDQVDVADAKPSAKSTENPSCDIARKNMALLQGKEPVQIDSNGDGKPDKTLSADDRANQMQLAQATVKVTCAAVVADKAAAPPR